jgi:DNA-binding NarL/FixJ family response regulator
VSAIRILVVDDFESWRSFVRATLQRRLGFEIVGEASDGEEAIQKAQELRPDLVLLDIGLPRLNGIEVARQIRKCLPKTKLLFLSENRSRDIIEEALRTGAKGYVVKSDAETDLLPAIEAAISGKRLINARLINRNSVDLAG